MSALAKPTSSQILLIDPLTEFLGRLDGDLASQVRRRFKYLVAASNSVLVPRTHAVSSDVVTAEQWLSDPCEKRTARVFRYERDRSIWSNPHLVEAINKERRPPLYICGFWLDDVVAAAAIEAQAYAFDTHIITDLSFAYSRERWQPFTDRMMQYGVVPILLNTLLYEWMANTDDSEKRQVLETMWKENKQIELAGTFAPQIGLS